MADDALDNLFEIETDPIFHGYSQQDVQAFVHDLFLVFNVLSHIDREYGEGDSPFVVRDIENFKKLTDDWNKKYRDIILRFYVTGIECRMAVYLKESRDNMLLILKRMKSFSKVKTSGPEMEAYFQEGFENRSDNTLSLYEEKGMFKLIYLAEDMLDPKSPEFKLCTFFGLKDGYDRTISLKKYQKQFSFDNISSSLKGEGWERRFPTVVFRT